MELEDTKKKEEIYKYISSVNVLSHPQIVIDIADDLESLCIGEDSTKEEFGAMSYRISNLTDVIDLNRYNESFLLLMKLHGMINE